MVNMSRNVMEPWSCMKCLPWPGTSLWHWRQAPGSDEFQLQGSSFAAGRSMSQFVQNKLMSLGPSVHYFKAGGDTPIEGEPWRTGTSENTSVGKCSKSCSCLAQLCWVCPNWCLFNSIWIDRFICYDLFIYGSYTGPPRRENSDASQDRYHLWKGCWAGRQKYM